MEQEQNNMQPTPTTPEPMPTQENAFPSADAKTGTSNYALIGGLIGLVIIAIGAWYVMKGNVTPEVVTSAPEIVVTPPPQTDTVVAGTETAPDATEAAMKVQGTSDEIGAIDADLKATDMGALNDINQI